MILVILWFWVQGFRGSWDPSFFEFFCKIIEITKNHETPCFFQHGKDAHRDSEKVALNDSSRSLIWNFWEQIVFLKIGEKVSKVFKLGQFWVRRPWTKPLGDGG